MSTIEDLERKVQSLQDQLAQAEKSLLAAKVAACAVQIGDIVRYTGAYLPKGTLCRVVAIEPKSWGATWLLGNPQKKDGTYGTRRRLLFDYWEKV